MTNSTPTFFWHYDVLTGQRIKFARIIKHKEPMRINGVSFKMDNVYDVPANEIHDEKAYTQPLDNPRKNINKAFTIYRHKMGLLNPKDVKHARVRLHLSQAEVSAILGMSYATLSKIENNHTIQSVSQDTELRNLFNGPALIRLIRARLPSIKEKRPSHVQLSDLIDAINLLESVEHRQKTSNKKYLQKYQVFAKLPIHDMIKAYCIKSHLSTRQLMSHAHISKSELDAVVKH